MPLIIELQKNGMHAKHADALSGVLKKAEFTMNIASPKEARRFAARVRKTFPQHVFFITDMPSLPADKALLLPHKTGLGVATGNLGRALTEPHLEQPVTLHVVRHGEELKTILRQLKMAR